MNRGLSLGLSAFLRFAFTLSFGGRETRHGYAFAGHGLYARSRWREGKGGLAIGVSRG